ncbi:hypothetical protein NGM99_10970 [Mesorhizobium sp. RP14(2022)]|uniref:Uncharacterized protein n=1 Tax=Mesorhizobium liriopis TaxID=2953882 RepID=A0ABT1C655_9HYPH|nr:hypothetical protein [Mesorhizobium liriopis]MCO6050305.1 hypothetical protein [Mesorhizobium liriopis]
MNSHGDPDNVCKNDKAARAELEDVAAAGHPPDTYAISHDWCSGKQTNWQHAQVGFPKNDNWIVGFSDRVGVIEPSREKRSVTSA